ncbi:Dabb family protein [Gramella sp. BOM4]|nr:Dabb family protein [Christiangramia bathymodioli]
MKSYFNILLLLVIFIGVQSSFAQTSKTEFDKNFSHVVYFWLNNPDNAEDREAFETSLKKFLNNSEYAQTNFIGVPADTPRDVVDNSYTYSLILSFPSREVQNKYQKEPAHLLFIEEASHLWKKVQVYDSVGIE